MLNLQQRIDLLERLGKYLTSDEADWISVKSRASRENGWFIIPFIDIAVQNIAHAYLNREKLQQFAATYDVKDIPEKPMTIGIVMAGNIPLVGFHDFLCVFLTGHKQDIKPSSRDSVLLTFIVKKMAEWNPLINDYVEFRDMLKGCDAYIATGSNNSARYFDYYFAKYPSIIRKNRTSVAILDGSESAEELDLLADDVHLYFGLGCRNVTKIFVPENYDFVPLLGAFRKYGYFFDHNKYKNNYDYQLALLLLNNKYYMTNDSILLVKADSVFSPISQLNYEDYSSKTELLNSLQSKTDIQCIVSRDTVPFGYAQTPQLSDFADGVDTMKFLQFS